MKQKVLITGATSGIGKAIADFYEGWDYEVTKVSRSVQDYHYNLCYPSEISSLSQRLHKENKVYDVLINNAGYVIKEDFVSVDKLWNLLLLTPYTLIRRLSDGGLLAPNSHIINIASVSGMVGEKDIPMYAALKAGVINLTKSFAKRLAPHIRVNCISPGFFDTNLFPGDTPKELINMVPLMRSADPEEIKVVIQMLDETLYITGANIVIDGGLSL